MDISQTRTKDAHTRDEESGGSKNREWNGDRRRVASCLREKSDSFSREVQSESSTPRPWFLLFHFLPSSAWADGNVAEAAVQLGKIVEHSKFKSTQPSPRPD